MTASLHRRLADARGLAAPAHRFAIGAAWFFIVISLAHLGWVVAVKWGDPQGVASLYHSTVAGETRHAWGLVYQDAAGLLLALFQAAVVTTAAALTLLPRRRHRRAGHLILIAWALLWTLDLMALTAFDHRLDSVVQTSILVLLTACTTYRAMRGWTPKKSPAAPMVAEGEPGVGANELPAELTGDDVTATERLRDITSHYRGALREIHHRGGIVAHRSQHRLEAAWSHVQKVRPILKQWRGAFAAGATRARSVAVGNLRRHGLLPRPASQHDSTSSR